MYPHNPFNTSIPFTESYQPNFSQQLEMPVSIMTDATSIEYIPNQIATQRQVEVLFALAAHVARHPREQAEKMVVLGSHSTLFAKIVLNMTANFTVDVVVPDPTQQQHANTYINSPNLFRCYSIPSIFVAFDEYDFVTFTSIDDIAQYPQESMPSGLQIATIINETQAIANHFAAHEHASKYFNVQQVDTLVTSAGKIFTVSGVKH